MTNNEAYSVIAKHIFVAMRKYEGNSVIILADNLHDAEEKAKAFFWLEFRYSSSNNQNYR